jgi:hypothetical protein
VESIPYRIRCCSWPVLPSPLLGPRSDNRLMSM